MNEPVTAVKPARCRKAFTPFQTLLLGWCALAPVVAAPSLSVWKVRVEEPTGIYRRTQEILRLPLDKLPGQSDRFTVIDPAGKEVPWQVAEDALLFPVSLIPGELPEFSVALAAS